MTLVKSVLPQLSLTGQERDQNSSSRSLPDSMTAVPKGWSRDPWDPQDPFKGATKSKSCMVVKEPFKVQHRPKDFDVTEYKKFPDIVSNSILQLTLKKLPLVRVLVQYQ